MRSYSLLAPAKINLYLEIIGSRADGYHELAMIMQSVDLSDRIDLRANGTDEFRVYCDHPLVPSDRSNLAHRAAVLIAESFPEAFSKFGAVDIAVEKRIPVGAGLAGGSTNAAAVLVGLDLMWNLGLTQAELQDLGAKLGSDVPFCISGGTAIATGRGEKLAPLPDLDHLVALLGKHRTLSVSTPWAYQTYRQQFGHTYADLTQDSPHPHSGAIVAAIVHKDSQAIAQHLNNDLEKVVLPAHPPVADLRNRMQVDAIGAMMSGSGPTVFSLTESRAAAEEMRSRLAAEFTDVDFWVAPFRPTGVRVRT
ncbi:4-(cytidine 5'-diphospho)-2-C-methyl-D-erythritol kinase [Microcoleus sp. FACHB-1515]|uniref:4-(cytidine 5'-diphospho)-2-C-methyl-D-erythritol kinase n=1 Tax=Cyanophyceae TaxID=3028117 RepID=UPI00168765A4|nr:4-(cytidine 5'-diphospho)-2-C-methyl-D-erythritol kinase [Microcoleus sp. FACHB-1515]MBD2091700.1 4-(cytidine 5'-diphospho)-2-C-methyl-D-erythritol kinase [Microcoleus sp. FACHB-1515]